jgi:hypothetical protein
MAGPYHGAHVCHPLKFNPCITTAIVLISARKGKKLSAKRTITVTNLYMYLLYHPYNLCEINSYLVITELVIQNDLLSQAEYRGGEHGM